MTFEEKRAAPRIHFVSNILITTGDGRIRATVDSKNISLKGIYVQAEQSLPVGTRCVLEVDLAGFSSNLRFRVNGKVCRHDSRGMGIAFCDLDAGTFIHLKNLIRLHQDKGN